MKLTEEELRVIVLEEAISISQNKTDELKKELEEAKIQILKIKEKNKNHTIILNNKLVKLLLMVLREASETRSDMGCNDAYSKEENLFTKEERKEMAIEYLGKIDAEDNDYYLANFQYVEYLIKLIKKQKSF